MRLRQLRRSAAGFSARLAGETPLPVPSATGLAKTGKGRVKPSRSAMVSITAKGAVGIPLSRSTCLVSPLCRQSAMTRLSEKLQGMP